MKRFYFVLRSNKTGIEYGKVVAAISLAKAVQLVTKYFPHYTQVSIKEL